MRPGEGSQLAGAIRGWMLIVPPLGLAASVTLSVSNIATSGDLNRRILASPDFGRVLFVTVLVLNLTVCGTLVRIARLPLSSKTRIGLMAWCVVAWGFAIPLLELTLIPESDGLPPEYSGDELGQDPWESALRRFHRRCKWALGVYVVIALEIVLATALWSAWRA